MSINVTVKYEDDTFSEIGCETCFSFFIFIVLNGKLGPIFQDAQVPCSNNFLFWHYAFLYQNKNPVAHMSDWRQFCASLKKGRTEWFSEKSSAIEIFSNLGFGSLEIRDTLVTRVTNKNLAACLDSQGALTLLAASSFVPTLRTSRSGIPNSTWSMKVPARISNFTSWYSAHAPQFSPSISDHIW